MHSNKLLARRFSAVDPAPPLRARQGFPQSSPTLLQNKPSPTKRYSRFTISHNSGVRNEGRAQPAGSSAPPGTDWGFLEVLSWLPHGSADP